MTISKSEAELGYIERAKEPVIYTHVTFYSPNIITATISFKSILSHNGPEDLNGVNVPYSARGSVSKGLAFGKFT